MYCLGQLVQMLSRVGSDTSLLSGTGQPPVCRAPGRPSRVTSEGLQSSRLMYFYCRGEANRVVMSQHLPQADVGGRRKSHGEVSHKAQGCLWARVQLTDKACDNDTLR